MASAQQCRDRQPGHCTGAVPVVQERGAEQILAEALATQAFHLGVIGTMLGEGFAKLADRCVE